MYLIWYTSFVEGESQLRIGPGRANRKNTGKKLPAIFFRTRASQEPVRDWLKSLSRDDRKRIGADIQTVEFGWPVGMPTCRPMGGGLFEVRTRLENNRSARTLFYVDVAGRMVLLHGLIKKTSETPKDDLDLARFNMREHKKGMP